MTKLIIHWTTLGLAVAAAALHYHAGLDMSIETFFEIGGRMALGFAGVAVFYVRMLGRGMREVGWL